MSAKADQSYHVSSENALKKKVEKLESQLKLAKEGLKIYADYEFKTAMRILKELEK